MRERENVICICLSVCVFSWFRFVICYSNKKQFVLIISRWLPNFNGYSNTWKFCNFSHFKILRLTHLVYLLVSSRRSYGRISIFAAFALQMRNICIFHESLYIRMSLYKMTFFLSLTSLKRRTICILLAEEQIQLLSIESLNGRNTLIWHSKISNFVLVVFTIISYFFLEFENFFNSFCNLYLEFWIN